MFHEPTNVAAIRGIRGVERAHAVARFAQVRPLGVAAVHLARSCMVGYDTESSDNRTNTRQLGVFIFRSIAVCTGVWLATVNMKVLTLEMY